MAYKKKALADYKQIGRKTNAAKGIEKKETLHTVAYPSHKKIIVEKFGSVAAALESLVTK